MCNCCISYIAKSVARLCVFFSPSGNQFQRQKQPAAAAAEAEADAGRHTFWAIQVCQPISDDRSREREKERECACMLTLPVTLSLSYVLSLSHCSLELFLGTVQHAASKPKLKSLW